MAVWTVTGKQSLLGILGQKLARAQVLTRALLLLVLRVLFVVAGFGCITAAAWMVAVPLGLFVAGLSLLVLEWAVKR